MFNVVEMLFEPGSLVFNTCKGVYSVLLIAFVLKQFSRFPQSNNFLLYSANLLLERKISMESWVISLLSHLEQSRKIFILHTCMIICRD